VKQAQQRSLKVGEGELGGMAHRRLVGRGSHLAA
jgi:hypothetical protein